MRGAQTVPETVDLCVHVVAVCVLEHPDQLLPLVIQPDVDLVPKLLPECRGQHPESSLNHVCDGVSDVKVIGVAVYIHLF